MKAGRVAGSSRRVGLGCRVSRRIAAFGGTAQYLLDRLGHQQQILRHPRPVLQQLPEMRARVGAPGHPLLQHRLGGGPQVQIRIELAAEALDVQERLLQQHQLGLHLHVELARRLKQAQQHQPERDVLEGLVEDGLADRADGRFQFRHPRIRRHPAGIHVQPGHAVVVALEEGQKVGGQVMLIPRTEGAHDAEVDGDVTGLLRVRHVDEDVPRMHVRMEEIVGEHLGEEDLDAVFGQTPDVGSPGLQFLDIADRHAGDALHGQDVGTAVVPVHVRHVKRAGTFEVSP